MLERDSLYIALRILVLTKKYNLILIINGLVGHSGIDCCISNMSIIMFKTIVIKETNYYP